MVYDHGHAIGAEIVPAAGIHIGLAVSAGDDLYTPVVKDADKLTLAEIHQRIEKLAEKARARTLSLEEMAGACLTISNLGMYPIESFTVIIPPGQSAALSVGAAQEVAVIRDGSGIEETDPIAPGSCGPNRKRAWSWRWTTD